MIIKCLFTLTVTRFLVKAASADPWRKETQIVWPKFRGDFHSDTVFTLTRFFEVIEAYSEQKGVQKMKQSGVAVAVSPG